MTTSGDRPPAAPGLDARLRDAIRAVCVAGLALAVAGAAIWGPRAGASIAAGAALAAGNLWALARIVAALLPHGHGDAKGSTDSRGPWVVLGLVKTAGLLLAAWVILSYRLAQPLFLLAGFVSLPIGIAIGTLVSDRRPQSKETL
jgi:hypothetical protein